jgi:hypothetical protein
MSQSLSPDGSVAMQAGISVLKKAQDIEAQNIQQLLQPVTTPAGTNNPPHLGNKVDVRA